MVERILASKRCPLYNSGRKKSMCILPRVVFHDLFHRSTASHFNE